MVGIRKYNDVMIDSPDWDSTIDFLGGATTDPQITTAKIILAGVSPSLLSSWQAAADKTKIDSTKISGIIPVGNLSPLTGNLDFAQFKALNILIDVLAGDPGAPLAGQLWYRSDTERLSLRRASVTDRIVLEDLAQTLAGKTLTTPTIASFVNATHIHQAAASGGTLDHGLALTGLTDDDHTQYVLRSIMTTRGDLFYRNATIVTRLALGTVGKLLRSDGTDLLYSTVTIPDTFTRGSFPVASAANILSALTIGAAGKILRSDGTDLGYTAWTIPASFAAFDMMYASAANILAVLAGNITTTRKFLRMVGDGVNPAAPAWDTLLAADIPSLDASKITTGAFAVARGGTGLATIAAGGILYASALDTLLRIAPSAANQVLRSTGANALEIAALVAADIPNLDAAKLTTGLLAIARGGLNNATWTALQLIRMNAGGTAFESSGKTIADFAAVVHKASHVSGGGDAFVGGDLLDATARLKVSKAATPIGTRRELNLIQGSNVTLTVTDDAPNEKVDVTIASVGGGAGSQVEIQLTFATEEATYTP